MDVDKPYESSFNSSGDNVPPVSFNTRLSSTVRSAYNTTAGYPPFKAIILVYEILKTHDDYVRPLYRSIFSDLEEQVKRIQNESEVTQQPTPNVFTAEQWLQQAIALLNLTTVQKVYGRLVIITLSLLDTELFGILSKDDYLARLSEEVKGDLKEILIPEAYVQFSKRILKQVDKTDNVTNQTDHALKLKEQDKIDRYAFAEFLVKLLNNTDETYGAYTLHLYAPWGAGKTSTLNFMKDIMQKDKHNANGLRWHIVDFNAWQNQHQEYPWWVMMNTIYKQVWKKLYKKPLNFAREFYWRLNSQTLNYFFALCVLAWLLFFFIIPVIKNSDNVLNDMGNLFEKLGKTVGGILAIWALVLGIGKYISGANATGAEAYLASRKDPMNFFHKRFKNIIEAIKPGRMAIFIDDLDRCKSSYVIALLESLQTLFNYENVFFIIAADKKWINACYEVEYNLIKPYISAEGKPIGTLFIEKMFQQSVALPGVHIDMKQRLWDSLLSDPSTTPPATDKKMVAEMSMASSLQERDDILSRSKNASFETAHAVRLEALKKLADKQTMVQTEHLLKPYSILLDMNPRSMKRLINNYSSIKASAIISHIDIPIHQIALWSILTMRWPLVAEHLLAHADIRNNTIVLDPQNIPAPIAALLRDNELKSLFNGGPNSSEGPFEGNTIVQCRQLLL